MDIEVFPGIITYCFAGILAFIKWPRMKESFYETYKLYTSTCFKKENSGPGGGDL